MEMTRTYFAFVTLETLANTNVHRPLEIRYQFQKPTHISKNEKLYNICSEFRALTLKQDSDELAVQLTDITQQFLKLADLTSPPHHPGLSLVRALQAPRGRRD